MTVWVLSDATGNIGVYTTPDKGKEAVSRYAALDSWEWHEGLHSWRSGSFRIEEETVR